MKTALLALAALVLAAPAAIAQTTTDDIEVARSIAAAERKMIVSKNLQLSEEEAEKFWPVYNDYHQSMRPVNDKRVKVLRELEAEFEGLPGERAQKMLAESLDFQQERVKVRKSYVKKFNAVLPEKKTVRYYQIESKLDTLIDYELARAIPLVE